MDNEVHIEPRWLKLAALLLAVFCASGALSVQAVLIPPL